MMRVIVIAMMMVMTFFGCAQVDKKYKGTVVPENGQVEKKEVIAPSGRKMDVFFGAESKTGLVVTAQINQLLSSEHFAYLDITFRNTTQDWVRLKSVTLTFGSQEIDKHIMIVNGQDILAWQRAVIRKMNIDATNKRETSSVLGFIGVALGAASDNDTMRIAGTSLVVASAVSLSLDEYSRWRNLNTTENTPWFPEYHLHASPIVVPPDYFDDRWILINTRDHDVIGYLYKVYIEYETQEGVSEKVMIELRSGKSGKHENGKWQSQQKQIILQK